MLSTVINKSTLEVIRLAHTPDYMDGQWLINPIFPECENKYFKIVNDMVVEMTSAEKKVVDDRIASEPIPKPLKLY